MTIIIDRKDGENYKGDGAKPVTAEQYIMLIAGKSVEVGDETWTIDDGPFYVPLEYLTERGGPGSGHYEHAGRPGEVGGSLPSGAVKAPPGEAPKAPPAEAPPGEAPRKIGIGPDISPSRIDSERFDPGSIRANQKDLTWLTNAQVRLALQEEGERAESLGIDMVYDRGEWLDRAYELSQAALDAEHDHWRISKEEFIENWNRSIANAGGDPDPRFVLTIMREVNDAVEQGWMPVPTVPVLIKLQDPDFNGAAQGSYTANGFTGEGAFIWMFQDPTIQGDSRTSRSGTDEPLLKWAAREEALESFDEEAGLVSQYFPSEMAAGVLHEMGHHWDDKHFNMNQGADDPQGRAFAIMGEEGGRDRIYQLISSYGATKPQEAVAEAFTLYHHPRYSELAQERRDIVEYILFGEGS